MTTTAPAASGAPPARGGGSAFGILLRKELLESIRTFRLPIVAGLFLFTGLSSPVLARYLPEIIELAGGDQLGMLEIPTPTTLDAVDQLVKNLAQFGALAAILLAMPLVSGEKDRGTAAFILTKPVTRRAFLWAKLAGLALVLGASTVIAVIAAWIYTALLFEPMPVGGWLWLTFLVCLWLFAFAALTFAGSVVTGSTAAAAGIGFVALLGLGIVSAIPGLGKFTPGGLLGPATELAANTVSVGQLGTNLFYPVVATIVLIAAAIAVSAWSFGRQEL
jgi:ABC-2 type transport system permease protein